MKKIETVADWLGYASAQLAKLEEIDTPQLEAQIIISFALAVPRSWLLAHTDFKPTKAQLKLIDNLLSQRLARTPLPYILGKWEFYNLEFMVSPDVLIPRPETELLVEEAITWFTKYPHKRRMLDLGTGSACIPVSLAVNVTDLHIVSVDVSRPALNVAMRNIIKHNVESRLTLLQSNLSLALNGQFDLITANLPYIPTHKLTGLAVSQNEPLFALDGGPDGLDLIRQSLFDAPRLIAHGGLLLYEIEAGQGQSVLAIAQSVFTTAAVRVINDLAGLPRLLSIEVS